VSCVHCNCWFVVVIDENSVCKVRQILLIWHLTCFMLNTHCFLKV